jgi:putative transposase
VSRYRFVEAERAEHAVTTMCRALKVSDSAYYAWRKASPSARALADAVISEKITGIHRDSRGTYGVPRVHFELAADHDIRCGRKRVARLMRAAGLQGVHRRRRIGLTRRDPNAEPSDDLVERNFDPGEPNRLWVADITQQRTWEGWLYVAVVIDAFSRRVVGLAIDDHLRTELVLEALEMAIARRRPGRDLVHHSDHGCQYTSLAFGRRIREAGIAQSMGSVGDCFDNAAAESFFATLECELFDRHPWPTRRQLRVETFDFIEGFYNQRRRHSTLGYLSPANYEAKWRDAQLGESACQPA